MAEFTSEEISDMVESFKKLGVKPKAETPDALKEWMLALAASGKLGDAKVPLDSSHRDHYRQPPRISMFSGSSKDTAFDIWKYEIDCLISERFFTADEILLAVRRSVKDRAARVLMHMGPGVSISDILHKFNSIFGSIDTGTSLLSSFYSAKQGELESATDFATRLEDLLSQAVQAGKVKPHDTNDMLCSVFYSGLNESIKSIAGYKLDKCTSFDEFRVEVRRIEAEFPGKLTAHSKAVTSMADDKVAELTGTVNQLRTELNSFKTQYERDRNSSGRGRSYNRGGRGKSSYSNSRYNNTELNNSKSFDQPIKCYRCGQEGHIRAGCRAKVDRQGRPLNSNVSMTKGHS